MATAFKGINSQEMSLTEQALKDYAEDIRVVFKKMDTSLEQNASHFNDDIGKVIRDKYSDISSNFNIITDNIVSIGDDFYRSKFNYEEQDEEIKA